MKNNEMTPMGALGRLQSASYSLKELPMSNWCDYNTKSIYATNGLIYDENVLEFAIDEDYENIKKALEENEELKKKIESYEKACKEIANKSPKNHINNCSLNDINEYINKLTDESFEIISPDNLIICEVYKLVKKKMKGEKYE